MSKDLMREKGVEEAVVLFETPNCSISQDDIIGRYILSFQNDKISFRACELISFRRKIQKIDIVNLLSSESPDVEIVSMPHCDRLFVLSIHQVLELKELFAGTFVMLELNSMIHKEIIRKGVLLKS